MILTADIIKIGNGETMANKSLSEKLPKKEFYVYCWWSGIYLEQQKCKVHKTDSKKIYFWNDYCNEYQEANIKDCTKYKYKMENYYINERVQH